MTAKSKETDYQAFVSHVTGKARDTLPKNKVTTASPKEIGFWKHFQMARAISHRRAGEATREEIAYLGRHGVYYYDTPKHIPRRHVPKKKKSTLETHTI